MLGLTEKPNPYTVIATTGSILDRGTYILDSTSGAITIKLPLNPATNQTITLADGFGIWGTNNITIDRNGINILNPDGTSTAEDLILDQNNMQLTLLYNGTTWRLM